MRPSAEPSNLDAVERVRVRVRAAGEREHAERRRAALADDEVCSARGARALRHDGQPVPSDSAASGLDVALSGDGGEGLPAFCLRSGGADSPRRTCGTKARDGGSQRHAETTNAPWLFAEQKTVAEDASTARLVGNCARMLGMRTPSAIRSTWILCVGGQATRTRPCECEGCGGCGLSRQLQ